MSAKDIPRAVISLALIGLFAFAYVENPSDDLLVGALIAMAGTAVNWWLGSSKGSSDKSEQLERQASQPQDVHVTNTKDDPAITSEAE